MAVREVVLLDDNEPLREAFQLLVEGKGYQVAAFAEGNSALDYLRENHELVGLIVLDLEMPVMSGFEFLAERAEDAELERIPVVVLTAVSGPHQFGACRVDAVLQKPVPSDELLALIRKYCGTAAPVFGQSEPRRRHKTSGVQPRIVHGTDFDSWYEARKSRG